MPSSRGRADFDDVAALCLGEKVVLNEDIGGLADGPHHVVGVAEVFLLEDRLGTVTHLAREVHNLVIGSVKGRTDEFRETGIDDDELLLRAFLDIEDFREERPHLSHDGTPQLEVKLLAFTQLEILLEDVEIGCKVGNRMVARVIIVDAQSTTYIDILCPEARGFQLVLQLVDAEAERAEVVHLQHL